MRRFPRVNYDEIALRRAAVSGAHGGSGIARVCRIARICRSGGFGHRLRYRKSADREPRRATTCLVRGPHRSFGMLRQARLKAPEIACCARMARRCRLRCRALISCAANSPSIISKTRACCARSRRFFGPAGIGRLALLRIFPGGAADRSARFWPPMLSPKSWRRPVS
jgi:hypothetical protein